MSKRQRVTTEKPAITEAELARIRAAAHRYLLAGGPIFRSVNDTDRDEHIAIIRQRLHPTAEPTFDQQLNRVLPSKERYDDHEALFSAAWNVVTAESEAAYLLGVCVGLEIAALAFVQPVAGDLRIDGRARKAGRR